MTVSLDHDDVTRFGAIIESVLGLQFDASNLAQLGQVLGRRLAATRSESGRYLDDLASERMDMSELNALADDLTVGETYFLRNIEQFNALVDEVVPQRLRARRGTPMRILSAGCSTGEEPYSIALCLREHSAPAALAQILAADVNSHSLDKAKRARYSVWALRETPVDMRERWFSRDGRDLVLADEIRSAVTFVHDNLAVDTPLWRPHAYDVIFCRNVMMYFARDQASDLVGRIARSLVPGGFLFLGHAETLRGLSTDFRLCHTNGTFYYQREGGPEDFVEPAARAMAQQAVVGTLSSSIEEAGSWVEAIRKASERVQQLTSTPPGTGVAEVLAGRDAHQWDLERPLLLLQEERFAEALGIVEALPPEAANDPEVALLLAVLLAHNGLFARAEDACLELLRTDERSAGAHYIIALCREGLGDIGGAIHHDQVAMHVDPGFAMARLHRGLLARRRDDAETARRELSHAITLLRREDSSRALLFGGGFCRNALIALCTAQISAIGGSG